MEEDLKAFARKVVAFANQLAGLASAAYFVLGALRREGPPLLSAGFLGLLGAGLLGLNLLRILYFRAGGSPGDEDPLLSHTRDGVVQVARDAIEAGLKSAGEALSEVSRLRVKVKTPAKRKVLIRAHYLAPEGTEIFDLSAKLRKTLLEAFERMVHLDREGRLEIDLIFEGFYGKQKAKSAPTQERKPPETLKPDPFTGPRYPIDTGDESL